jgi:anti-sigma factor RsiW
MDCRTFHRKLEDYLEGGLDFPGRFGMERHAKQCFACGKDIAEAVNLRRMARELQRVPAPPNFEATLLVRIREEKASRRFWKLHDLWLFGPDRFSWRTASVAGLVMALIAGATLTLHYGGWLNPAKPPQAGVSRSTAPPPEPAPGTDVNNTYSPLGLPSGLPDAGNTSGRGSAFNIRSFGPADQHNWITPFVEPGVSDFVDILVPVSGGRQLSFRLPKTIGVRFDQAPQDYYFRKISY